ncbi:hypothetical protein, partial [Rhizobium leguminosarum]|uniref:hypothetical protein n=1 Tax=Rhizobium leguminosarum TaxID=384 RepID=UPI003F94C7A0
CWPLPSPQNVERSIYASEHLLLQEDVAKREFSSFCALAIHTVVFTRSLFELLGGMDESLQTCEDWEITPICGASCS